MSSKIISTVEANQAELATSLGLTQGYQSGLTDSLVSMNGDFFLSLAYAALFFPDIQIRNGVPVARFATSEEPIPLDCFHVNLLHHNDAAGRSSNMYSAVGEVLAEAWNHALGRNGFPGRFVFDASTGSDILYRV